MVVDYAIFLSPFYIVDVTECATPASLESAPPNRAAAYIERKAFSSAAGCCQWNGNEFRDFSLLTAIIAIRTGKLAVHFVRAVDGRCVAPSGNTVCVCVKQCPNFVRTAPSHRAQASSWSADVGVDRCYPDVEIIM